MRRWKKAARAFTLVEVMVGILILTLVSLTFMASVVFMINQGAKNRDHMQAMHLMAYYEGLIRASRFEVLGEPTVASTDFEYQFRHRRSSPLSTYANPALTEGTAYNVSFEFRGWGTVSSATADSLTVTVPSNHLAWETDRWVDGYVTITRGFGQGQIGRITANTGDTLTITTDLTGATDRDWDTIPGVGAEVRINNGKTVDVQISWGDGANYKTLNRTILKPEIGI